jgi:hypothetical protein
MAYPQPLSSQEVIEGQQFFRLSTLLQSGGDAYELDTGALAFALGPQSDLSAVRLTYFDPSQPSQVNSAVVGIDTPFIGRIDALASIKFTLANIKAQIIVTPEDLWNNNWFPTILAENVNYIRPRLDLISYLTPPISLPLKRADFVERGRLNISVGSTAYRIAVPFYCRKFAELIIRNNSVGVAGLTVDVVGVTFTTDGVAPYALGDFIAAETPIITGGAVAAGANSVTTFRVPVQSFSLATGLGLFDYLMFRINGAPIDGAVADAVRYILRTTDDQI